MRNLLSFVCVGAVSLGLAMTLEAGGAECAGAGKVWFDSQSGSLTLHCVGECPTPYEDPCEVQTVTTGEPPEGEEIDTCGCQGGAPVGDGCVTFVRTTYVLGLFAEQTCGCIDAGCSSPAKCVGEWVDEWYFCECL